MNMHHELNRESCDIVHDYLAMVDGMECNGGRDGVQGRGDDNGCLRSIYVDIAITDGLLHADGNDGYRHMLLCTRYPPPPSSWIFQLGLSFSHGRRPEEHIW